MQCGYISKNKGFALIATISVMVLLVMVALAMLSLSTIELRSSRNSDAMSVARANARMSLMLAIGDLQKELGPDKRITANAGIMANDSGGNKPDQQGFDGRTIESAFNHPHWLGVWDSWDNWMSATGFESTYDRGRTNRFRRYIVSHPNPGELERIDTAKSSSGSMTMATMVGDGTLGSSGGSANGGAVLAPIVSVGDDQGFAYWVTGENQKSVVSHHVDSNAPSGSIASAAMRLADQPGVGVDWIDGLDDYPYGDADTLDKSVTLPTLGVATGNKAFAGTLKKHFHDLTSMSMGLPVNVRDGQLKRDINTLLELPKLPDEYGTYGSGNIGGSIVSIRTFNGDEGSIKTIYPQNRKFPSWYKLHQFYQLAVGATGYGEEVALDQRGIPFKKGVWWNGNAPHTNFNWHIENLDYYGYGRTPIVSRMMFIFSLTRKASQVAGRYDYAMNYTPVITLWNPYNVTMHAPPFWLNFTPGALEYKSWINNTLRSNWAPLGTGAIFRIDGRQNANSLEPIVLKPGEARIFSVKPGATRAIVTPGYDPPTAGGGFDVPLPNLRGLNGTDNVEFAMRMGWVKYDHAGQYQHYLTVRNAFTAESQRYNEMATNPVEDGKPIPIIAESDRVRFPASTQRLTIGSFAYVLKSGERLVNPAPYDKDDFRFKSFAHSKPWNQRSMYGQATKRMKAFVQYDIHITGGAGNAVTVDYDPKTNRGYVASASSLGGDYPGQTMAPMADIPVVTPTSLAGFMFFKLNPGDTRDFSSGRHLWDISANDALSIGSSLANPMVAGNNIHQWVRDAGAQGGPLQMQLIKDFNDHVFLINDGIWDRWFCSGITSQQAHPYGQKRGIKDVASDFLNGSKPLNNSHLVPHLPVGETSTSSLNKLFSATGPREDAHKKIAQYLMIKGAFNVNSTSVDAWKALFAGLRDTEVRYIDPESGSVKTKTLSSSQGGKVVTSRFSLPSSPNEGADAGDPNSWRGIRLLTEAQIDKLALECVRQVKLRGPFLNMSDFISRRLATDETGLCGALQAAIDWDEYNGNTPGSGSDSINGRYKGTDDMISAPASWGLPFQRAGSGSRWTAIPGYLMQPDLLKRIGNVLTPRDDTFRVRAYGEAKDSQGKVIAKAWCEAVVVRTLDYLDSADEPDVPFADLTREVNKKQGRRLKVVSFRWLSHEEI